MQTLYVIYCLKSSALVLVPPSSNQKHSKLNLWKLTIMITARLIFCLSYSIDILILCLKNSKLPCQKELNLRILIAKKERDTQCMMNAHHMMERIILDHNDPSKPSHRLTNGPEPSKTIESDGSNIKKPS